MIYALVILCTFSLLISCEKAPLEEEIEDAKPTIDDNTIDGDSDDNSIDENPEVFEPVPFPEGVHLHSLYFHEQGMCLTPYYLVHMTEKGMYFKLTSMDPEVDTHWIYGQEELSEEEIIAKMMKIDPEERASLVPLDDESVRSLEKIIEDNGVLNWNGFSQHVSTDPDLLDGGESFSLIITLSDGSEITAKGFNAFPDHYGDFRKELLALLNHKTDYSHYEAKNFTDAKPLGLFVKFETLSRDGQYYKLELNSFRSQWIIVLEDKQGKILPKGTSISEYASVEDPLPFEPCIALLKEYGLEAYNGKKEQEVYGEEYLRISIDFDDGKSYDYYGRLSFEKAEEFKKAFVEEIMRLYKQFTE